MPSRRLASRPAGRPTRWPRAVVATVLTGCLVVVGAGQPLEARAAEAPALQTIAVRQVRDGSLTRVTDTTLSKDPDSGQVSSRALELDPSQAVDELPVRVVVEYQLDGADGQGDRAGTDLSQIVGRSGRVTMRLRVQNLTVVSNNIEYTADGARYRQAALVGVPLTVLASATVPTADGTQVVVADAAGGRTVTDGLVTETGRGMPYVQWAAMLAPPLLSPTATFTLVEDTASFQPPQFDLAVQAGMVTDPSLENMLATALGSRGQAGELEQSTIELIVGVNQQIAQAEDFVDKVHQSLVNDAQALGAQAYAELQASSTAMLAQIDASQQSITAVQQQAAAQVQSANSQLAGGLSQVLAQLSAALGSADGDPPIGAAVVEGCSLTLPTLAPDTPRTLAATIQLVGQQLSTVATAFDTPDPDTPERGSCRQRLLDQLAQAIGYPGQTCPDDPDTPQVEPVTVQCAITTVGDRVWDQIAALQALQS
ncbi:MAG: hypothetical protein LBL55_02485, partial [Propionibacteriaceae bacterium]|nr:hypothetical protein [Propionibacteriaceae bacterium]